MQQRRTTTKTTKTTNTTNTTTATTTQQHMHNNHHNSYSNDNNEVSGGTNYSATIFVLSSRSRLRCVLTHPFDYTRGRTGFPVGQHSMRTARASRFFRQRQRTSHTNSKCFVPKNVGAILGTSTRSQQISRPRLTVSQVTEPGVWHASNKNP